MSAVSGRSPTIGPDGFAQAQEAQRPDTQTTQLQPHPYNSFKAIPQSSQSKIARFFFGSGVGENTNAEKKYYVDHLDRQIKQLPSSNYKSTLTVFRNAIADETDIGKIRNMLPQQNLTHLKHAAKHEFTYTTLSSTVERLKQSMKALWENVKGAFIGFSDVKNDINKIFGRVKAEVSDPNQMVSRIRKLTLPTIAPAKKTSIEALMDKSLSNEARIANYKRFMMDQVDQLKKFEHQGEEAANIIAEFKTSGDPQVFAKALTEKVQDMFPGQAVQNPDILFRRNNAIEELEKKIGRSALPESVQQSAKEFLNEAKKLKDNTLPQGIENGVNNIIEESGFTNTFSLDNEA